MHSKSNAKLVRSMITTLTLFSFCFFFLIIELNNWALFQQHVNFLILLRIFLSATSCFFSFVWPRNFVYFGVFRRCFFGFFYVLFIDTEQANRSVSGFVCFLFCLWRCWNFLEPSWEKLFNDSFRFFCCKLWRRRIPSSCKGEVNYNFLTSFCWNFKANNVHEVSSTSQNNYALSRFFSEHPGRVFLSWNWSFARNGVFSPWISNFIIWSWNAFKRFLG